MSIIEYTGPSNPQEIRKYLQARTKDMIISEYLRLWREFGKVEAERDALAAHVKLLEEMRLRAQADYLLEHSDGETDCVTPYDIYGGPETSLARHHDDAAVDRFAEAMKAKLAKARGKGRGGWEDIHVCRVRDLVDMMVEHLSKGNEGTWEDIANFAMMLHQRGDAPAKLADGMARLKAGWQADAVDDSAEGLEIDGRYLEAAQALRHTAAELRRQAEGGK